MEFRIAKTEFLRGLRLAQGVADRKSTMPMLANVLLRMQGKNQLLVAATDLNVSLTADRVIDSRALARRQPAGSGFAPGSLRQTRRRRTPPWSRAARRRRWSRARS